ncbi:MAG: MBL fold metallo-hydrolase [Candidatus Sumerlaeia bacterium]
MNPISRTDDLAALVPQERTNPLKISVLVDNAAGEPRLIAEHGLALLIEVAGRRILFDSGAGSALEHNARQLKIKLDRLTDMVVSHSHYDHTSGIPAILDFNPGIRIYAHPELFNPRYSRGELPPHRQIGLPEEVSNVLRQHVPNIIWTPTPTPITEGVWVTGAIPRKNDFEDAGGPFFLDPECATRPDPIEGDQAVWAQTPNGIVVILGCAHAGVVNTLERVARLTKANRFHAVIGGMHLLRADRRRLHCTVEAFDRYQVDFVGPCHCTGDSAQDFIRRAVGSRYLEVKTGMTLEF